MVNTDKEPALNLALPVAIFSCGEKLMVSTVSYCDLYPLTLTACLNKNSSTAKLILQKEKFLVSYLADSHSQALEIFAAKKDCSGFRLAQYQEEQTVFIEDALFAFAARLTGKIEHQSSFSIYFQSENTLPVILPLRENHEKTRSPLIRYNRSYAKLAPERIPSKDNYPV